MKFLLFRILLLHRTRDRGFTLPMVVGIGLIMVLLGSMSLVQSSEENLNTISKNQSSTSLAMAELGVARYRELLNNNRVLAVYSLDGAQGWKTTNVSDQTCDTISSAAGGWADTTDATGWRDITLTLDENAHSADLNFDGDQTDTIVEPIGSYKLVNYVYQNDNDVTDDGDDEDTSEDGDPIDPGEDGVFDQTSDTANANNPRGILTVQGQATDTDSVAQIQVTIPIGVNINDLVALDPGIWIYQDSENVTDFGALNFDPGNGNLVLYRDSAGDGCNNVTVAGGIDAIRDPRNLPPLATIPANFNNLIGDISANSDFANNELILGKRSATSNLDSDGSERYYYEVPGTDSLDIGAAGIGPAESLLADGEAKVVVIVGGDLNIFSNSLGDDTFVANTSGSATSKHLEIHVNGNVTIWGDGIVNINALINARNGTFRIDNNATVNLTGSIWANNLDNANGTLNVTTSDYEFYSVTTQRTPKPLTYAPTGWQTQEAN